jgi:two-component system LytT family response regulator
MTTIRTLIVDDEELARRGLELRLAAYDDVEIVGQCRNGREALQAMQELAPDLIFLDVQMPGLSGFDVLRRLSGSRMPAIVFVTAFDEYALRAFDANAIDYLLKPINDERLAESVDRVRGALRERKACDHRTKLLRLLCELTGRELTLDDALSGVPSDDSPRFPRRLAIQDGRQTNCVDVEAIDWVDAAGDYMCVHAGGEIHVLRGTMKRLEELLDPEVFVRVHRSAIVNRNRVRAMRPHRNGEYFLKLSCNHELKLSRKYKANVQRIADSL